MLGDATVESAGGGRTQVGCVLYGGPDWLGGREQSLTQGSPDVAGDSEAGMRRARR